MIRQGIPALPNVPHDVSPSLRPFLQALRDAGETRFGLGKNGLDRSPTVRELQDIGLINSTYGRNLSMNLATIGAASDEVPIPIADYAGPPTHTGVAYTVSLAGVFITWTPFAGWDSVYTSHTEIWRVGPFNLVGGAYPAMSVVDTDGVLSVGWVNPAETKPLPALYLVGISSLSSFADALPPSAHFQYFIRSISHDDRVGDWYDLNGTRVDSSVDAQLYLDMLSGQIEQAHLSSELSNSIDVILAEAGVATSATDLFEDHELLQRIRNLGAVAREHALATYTTATVLTEETSRSDETSALAQRATAMEVTIDTPGTGLSARATGLETFQVHVEDQTGTGFLAESTYLLAMQTALTDADGLLGGRATTLETFKTHVEDQGETGFFASATYIAALVAEVEDHSADWIAQATVNASVDGRTTGRYFNRIDVDGRITGLEYFDGVGDLQQTSNFIIKADTFQVRTTTSDTLIMAMNGDAFILDVDVIDLQGLIPSANIGEITADKLTITGLAGVSTIADVIIGEGHIDNAKIGNFIQSTSYNPTSGIGWRLDKAGHIEAASITIRDSSGNVIMSSGGALSSAISNASQTWSQVSGAGKPENYANNTTNTNQLSDGAGLGNSATWSGVSGTGKPADNADVTAGNTAAGITGQGALATVNQITVLNASTYIQALAVDTLFIAGNAVSVPAAFLGTTRLISAGMTDVNCASGYSDPQGGKVLCTFSGTVNGDADFDGTIRMAIGSEYVYSQLTVRANGGVSVTSKLPISFSVISNSFYGSNPCNVSLSHVSNGSFIVSNCILTMTGLKK